jgi:hypothetical protein
MKTLTLTFPESCLANLFENAVKYVQGTALVNPALAETFLDANGDINLQAVVNYTHSETAHILSRPLALLRPVVADAVVAGTVSPAAFGQVWPSKGAVLQAAATRAATPRPAAPAPVKVPSPAQVQARAAFAAAARARAAAKAPAAPAPAPKAPAIRRPAAAAARTLKVGPSPSTDLRPVSTGITGVSSPAAAYGIAGW